MNLTHVETAIYTKIGQFKHLDTVIQIENQPTKNGQPFKASTNKPWCKVFAEYADSRIVGTSNKPYIRDQGVISIQCFTPKNKGTLAMTALCDAWRDLLQSFNVSHLEIYKVHAPQSIQDNDFYAKIIRAEFRVN